MKRILLIVALVVAAVMPSAAQFRFGAEAGANFTTGVEDYSGAVGFNVGVTGEYSITPNWIIEAALKLSSQPLKYNELGGEYYPSDDYLNPRNELKYSTTPYYLVLPIRTGYRFNLSQNCKMTIGLGPSFGVGLFGRESVTLKFDKETYKEHSSELFHGYEDFSSSRFEVGVNARVGVELFNHYTVGLDYNYWHICGRNKLVEDMHVFSLSVGYKF